MLSVIKLLEQVFLNRIFNTVRALEEIKDIVKLCDIIKNTYINFRLWNDLDNKEIFDFCNCPFLDCSRIDGNGLCNLAIICSPAFLYLPNVFTV